MILPRALACTLILLAAGCATGGEFPSLAPRPVEQLSFEEPVRVDPPVAPDAALRARAGALVAQAREGDRAFEGAHAAALPRIRAPGATGSDSWIQAQEAISRVEAARGATTGTLTEFDAWLVELADEPVNAELWAEIAEDRAAISALVDEQRQRLDSLKSSVSRP